jgi:hypothetical protein
MTNLRVARLASLACLAGGTVQIIYGLLSIPAHYGPGTDYGWDEALWAVANAGMIGAVVGLLALDVARPRWLAVIGATLGVLGNLIRIVVSVVLIKNPTAVVDPYILSSIGLMLMGMGALGVATLVGRQLEGWRRWTPFLVAGFALITAPTYYISLSLHFFLLGLWGVPWMLIGYAVLAHAASRRQAIQAHESSPVL